MYTRTSRERGTIVNFIALGHTRRILSGLFHTWNQMILIKPFLFDAWRVEEFYLTLAIQLNSSLT